MINAFKREKINVIQSDGDADVMIVMETIKLAAEMQLLYSLVIPMSWIYCYITGVHLFVIYTLVQKSC